MISGAGQTARNTERPAVPERFRDARAAQTFLTTLTCRRLSQDSNSIPSFVQNLENETTPGGIQNRTIQPGLLPHVSAGLFDGSLGRSRHVPDVETLHRNQAVAVHQLAAQFVLEVVSPAKHFAVRRSNSHDYLSATLAAPFASCQLASFPA